MAYLPSEIAFFLFLILRKREGKKVANISTIVNYEKRKKLLNALVDIYSIVMHMYMYTYVAYERQHMQWGTRTSESAWCGGLQICPPMSCLRVCMCVQLPVRGVATTCAQIYDTYICPYICYIYTLHIYVHRGTTPRVHCNIASLQHSSSDKKELSLRMHALPAKRIPPRLGACVRVLHTHVSG